MKGVGRVIIKTINTYDITNIKTIMDSLHVNLMKD